MHCVFELSYFGFGQRWPDGPMARRSSLVAWQKERGKEGEMGVVRWWTHCQVVFVAVGCCSQCNLGFWELLVSYTRLMKHRDPKTNFLLHSSTILKKKKTRIKSWGIREECIKIRTFSRSSSLLQDLAHLLEIPSRALLWSARTSQFSKGINA